MLNFKNYVLGVKSAVRGKRALKFHEPGKFVQIADRIRVKAQLEKLQNEISQIARKTGISSATKLALIAPKTEALNEDVPNVEWWDSVILNGDYNSSVDDVNKVINANTITNLVEHPAQMRPPSKYKMTYLTLLTTMLLHNFINSMKFNYLEYQTKYLMKIYLCS